MNRRVLHNIAVYRDCLDALTLMKSLCHLLPFLHFHILHHFSSLFSITIIKKPYLETFSLIYTRDKLCFTSIKAKPGVPKFSGLRYVFSPL